MDEDVASINHRYGQTHQNTAIHTEHVGTLVGTAVIQRMDTSRKPHLTTRLEVPHTIVRIDSSGAASVTVNEIIYVYI